jgi:hypothetical protein
MAKSTDFCTDEGTDGSDKDWSDQIDKGEKNLHLIKLAPIGLLSKLMIVSDGYDHDG